VIRPFTLLTFEKSLDSKGCSEERQSLSKWAESHRRFSLETENSYPRLGQSKIVFPAVNMPGGILARSRDSKEDTFICMLGKIINEISAVVYGYMFSHFETKATVKFISQVTSQYLVCGWFNEFVKYHCFIKRNFNAPLNRCNQL
jgi:hypothetical protein